jgi:hypothetical protein
VTIAGGMVCADGVILYADTEWSCATMKIQRPKHWRLGTIPGRLRCAIAGAGDEDYLRLAIQFLKAGLKNVQSPLRSSHVFQALSQAIRDVYTNHIYPDPNGNDNEFGMLVAVSTPEDAPVIFKTVGTGLLIVDDYEHLGVGYEMAGYLISKIFMSEMPIAVAELLAAYVLWEVKSHVQACGGDTVLYALGNDGSFRYRPYGHIRDLEEHFGDFEKLIRNVRLQAANLEITDEEFSKILDGFTLNAKQYRQARIAKRDAEKTIGTNPDS